MNYLSRDSGLHDSRYLRATYQHIKNCVKTRVMRLGMELVTWEIDIKC